VFWRNVQSSQAWNAPKTYPPATSPWLPDTLWCHSNAGVRARLCPKHHSSTLTKFFKGMGQRKSIRIGKRLFPPFGLSLFQHAVQGLSQWNKTTLVSLTVFHDELFISEVNVVPPSAAISLARNLPCAPRKRSVLISWVE
jgi:hypothetical protein